MENTFVLHGDICHSAGPRDMRAVDNGYLVCENGVSRGVYPALPDRYAGLPVADCSGKLIIPGLCDLHMHAPQYSFRALGMDLELLEWLNTRTFPEEAKYSDPEYAAKAYDRLVRDLTAGPNARLCLFGTMHVPATVMLMDMLERSGLVSMVGKVNMDRNSPDSLREASPEASLAATRDWLERTANRYVNTRPILTPRFIPSCSDELSAGLAALRRERSLPLQSHLSENQGEIDWVRELCPDSACYADAYRRRGLLDQTAPVIMAHCVWSGDEETAILKDAGAFVAHCPQSNMNLSSGIAPARRFLERGVNMGLGSDVAGGCHASIFRAMADAIQSSKLRWRLCDGDDAALTVEEAFWLGTAGGGAFFGRVGRFDDGYEFDALVIDDEPLRPPFATTAAERLARVVYLSDDRHIERKYVRGARVK